ASRLRGRLFRRRAATLRGVQVCERAVHRLLCYNFLARSFNVAAQAEQLVEGLAYGSFRVFLLKRLLPIFGGLLDSREGLVRGEPGLLAVHEANSVGFEH